MNRLKALQARARAARGTQEPAEPPRTKPLRGRALLSETLARQLELACSTDPLLNTLYQQGRHPSIRDDSVLDFQLCVLLSFWLNRDHDQIDQAFRQSARMTDRWDIDTGGKPYGARTIEQALKQQQARYGPPPGPVDSAAAPDRIAVRYRDARAQLEAAFEAVRISTHFKAPHREALTVLLDLIDRQVFEVQGVSIRMDISAFTAAYAAAGRPSTNLEGSLVFLGQQGLLGQFLRTGHGMTAQRSVLMPVQQSSLTAFRNALR